ncbi:MAG TPA: hypothetical protein ENH85_05485 [Candidatus Scalindua sp.]|nr:hypothetical protein [Candidatus Scalindua sp.]
MKKQCPRCKIKKELSVFNKSKDRKDGLQVYCKDCRKKYAQSSKEYQRNYRKKNVNKMREYQREYAIKNKGKLYDKKCRWLNKLKLSAFNAYGGAKCSCCGEKEFIFLCIDHINGGGTKQRSELPNNGNAIYIWLKDNNYPVGYRVLCHNCNWGVYKNNGICPHRRK